MHTVFSAIFSGWKSTKNKYTTLKECFAESLIIANLVLTIVVTGLLINSKYMFCIYIYKNKQVSMTLF